MTPPEQATLSASPLGDCIDDCISSKVSFLKIMEDRLQHLQAHDALLLLCHSFIIPRLIYLLRTAPCFLSLRLSVFDEVLRRMLSRVTNICFPSDDNLWLQASLPVQYGGLVIRCAVQLAPSAFLSSCEGSSDLVHQILPQTFGFLSCPEVDLALLKWSKGHTESLPLAPLSHSQRAWDTPGL